MEKAIKISECPLSRFSNALHAQFHNQIYRLIDQWPVELSVINVSDELMKEWKKLIDTEIDINREVSASADTKKLTDLDKQRDDLVVYLFGAIRTARRSPLANQKEAAERLYLTVKRYAGLQNETYDEETIHIDGLVVDFTKADAQHDLTVLGIYELVHTLAGLNNDYRALRSQRSATRAQSKLPQAKEIRPQSDAVFERVCQLIEVSYLLCNQPGDKSEIVELVDKMNQQIAELKTVYKQSVAQTAVEPKRPPRRKTEEQAE